MKSITLRVFLLMLGFGLAMGLIFPFFTKLFVALPPQYVIAYTLCCIGAGLTVGLVNFYIVKRVILAFIAGMAVKLEQMAESGLEQVEVMKVDSPDAIGDLTRRFNVFLSLLQGMVGRTRHRIDSTRTQSGRLTTAMDESSRSIQEVGAATERLSTTMETQGREILAVGHIATAQQHQAETIHARLEALFALGSTVTEGFKGQARDVTRLRDLLSSVGEGIGSMKGKTRDADEASKSLQGFATRSRDSMGQMLGRLEDVIRVTESIRSFVDVIGAVASQTKLLAMNASIEAAHAGVAGKGFAVVAQEIRKLSDSANRQAVEARTALGHIQSTIQGSREMVEKTRGDFEGCLEGFGKLAQTLEGVLHTSETIGRASEEAMGAVRETESRGRAGIEAQEKAQSLYGEVRVEAKGIQEGVAAVSSRLTILDELTGEIRGALAGVSRSMAVVDTAFQHVSILAQANRDQMADLDRDLRLAGSLPGEA